MRLRVALVRGAADPSDHARLVHVSPTDGSPRFRRRIRRVKGIDAAKRRKKTRQAGRSCRSTEYHDLCLESGEL